jgi:HEAT repeat protein
VRSRRRRFARPVLALFALLSVGLVPTLVLRAQKSRNTPVSVAGVSERKTGGGTVITLSADTPVTRTQTWQDDEGFHLILPHAGRSQVKGIPKGVRVRQLDESLELLLPVKPGASVTVEPHFNHLNLVINGSLDPSRVEREERAQQLHRRQMQQVEEPEVRPSAELFSPRIFRETRSQQSAPSFQSAGSQSERFSPPPVQPLPASTPLTQSSAANTQGNAQGNAQANGQQPQQAAAQASPIPSASPSPNAQTATQQAASASTQPLIPPTDGAQQPAPAAAQKESHESQPAQVESSASLLSSLFSGTGVCLFLLLGGATLFFLRRRSNREAVSVEKEKQDKQDKDDDEKTVTVADESTSELESSESVAASETEQSKGERRKRRRGRRRSDAGILVQKVTTALPVEEMENGEQALEIRQPGSLRSAASASSSSSHALFGAYRVDQEVGKLILGQPYRLDVLLSRANDDRRAMEASLLKALQSPESGEDTRRRARKALEEYGFVARQSAALLLAHDAYERASAARTLGEIRSPLALSFLIEALHDGELVVRTHAVSSLGMLRVPSAIGALLDMAWRHPEMSAEHLSRVLEDCSVETLDCRLAPLALEAESQASISDHAREFTGEITRLDPAARVEQLPEWLEDQTLAEALALLESADVEARIAAVRQLAQFQVQRSVEALTFIASRDEESAVRAAAVSSLCAIDHESVFAPVLIALADEAREVRAAAARSLTRLSFDRADAYVRVLETSDEETLRLVALSCIKAGIVAQAIDRLTSEDRRQAYEAFSMLSLLAKSNETEPVIEAIAGHGDINVRLAATRLLGLSGRPEVAAQLRQLVVRDGLPEKVRTAILEVVYKIDQAQPV